MGLEVLKRYWREVLIIALAVTGFLFYKSWRYQDQKRALAENEIHQATVKFQVFQDGVAQAQNTLIKSQKELLDGLSESMKADLERSRQQVLATVATQLQVEIDKRMGKAYPIGEMEWLYSDEVLQRLSFDARVPASPTVEYEIKPFTISLKGALNMDNDGKTVKFWAQPEVTSNSPFKVSVAKMELSPSEAFNAWTTSLGHHTDPVSVVTLPKWTVSGMVGQEFLKDLPGGARTVWGAELSRNYTSGATLGGGFLGSTIYIKAGYSFGKQ